MKLVTFIHNGLARVGAAVNDGIVDSQNDPELPMTMLGFLAGGDKLMKKMQQLIEDTAFKIPLADVTLLAPVPRPGKYMGIALNYTDHIAESNKEKPEYPSFFTKQATCVIGHGDAIYMPRVSNKLDYEGELAFVIGKRCRHVPVEQASQVIAGFMVANDVSIRDWQARSPTLMIGKSFDTSGPLGPWLVTSDEINDPHNLSIKTWIDDELRQDSNTKHMIFNCYDMVAYLSQVMTLEPGDVITTGTPSGVGVSMKPRGYMRVNQTVHIEIEGIGTLTNTVINEPIDNVIF